MKNNEKRRASDASEAPNSSHSYFFISSEASWSYLGKFLGCQDASKTPQDGAQMGQDGAKTAQDSAKTDQAGAKTARNSTKTLQDGAETVQDAPKTFPNRDFRNLGAILGGFGRPRRAQDGLRWRASEARERAKRAKRAERWHTVPSQTEEMR